LEKPIMGVSISGQLYLYLLSCLITLITILSAVWILVVTRRRAKELDILEQRIPDAARLEDLQQRLADAEKEWQARKEELAQARAVVAQKEDAARWLKENQEQLRSLQAEREQQEKLRAVLEELQRQQAIELEQSRQQRKELEAAEFRLNSVKGELGQLEPQLEQARNAKAVLEKALETLTVQKAGLEAEQARLEEQVRQWRQQCEDIRAELARIKGERDGLSKDVQDLRDRKAELDGEVGSLNATRNRLAGETGQNKDRLADLWHHRLDPKRFDGKMPSDELKCLGQVAEYLVGHGLRFPTRILHAFHTSLKIADISPLVVLAGISGTGKSELPRRYAEAMGMHFLNIAVQPRWDSPQDMFGFFNYMEGRYRATELARALVQMDPYWDEKGRGWACPSGWDKKNTSTQMLLVLLDEMNLARVEYYFSEFLSRLEIRRGIAPRNAEDRRKAEIPLEVGGVAGAQSIMQLFVDTNVLFAGTMNEDETTQTLSDKVVDRANVLRFGKPARLTRDVITERPEGSSKALLFDNWAKWRKTEDKIPTEMGDKVTAWIQQLNEIMTLVRRPFAFRTEMAMRSYIANYPHNGNAGEAVRWAMVDQIEQRILPKFRGLDPSEPAVGKAIGRLMDLFGGGQLDDPRLKEAINQARSGGEHLFSWQGVDRTEAD
jgi:archaellum component FlaC